MNKTKPLDEKQQEEKNLRGNGERHKLHVFANFRPGKKREKLNQLINLASENLERLFLTISLSLNRGDAINRAMAEKKNDALGNLISGRKIRKNGLIHLGNLMHNTPNIPNLRFNDVRHDFDVNGTGRMIPKEKLENEKDPEKIWRLGLLDGRDVLFFKGRGHGFPFFNPGLGLCLAVHATAYESHTGIAYARIREDNLLVLSKIPFNRGGLPSPLPVPPNWPGGRGEDMSDENILRCQEEAERTKTPKPLRGFCSQKLYLDPNHGSLPRYAREQYERLGYLK